jgi:peptidoglycan-associated lipoprotein
MKILIGSLTLVLMTACSSTPTTKSSSSLEVAQKPIGNTANPPPTQSTSGVSRAAIQPTTDPRAIRSIYFDFDDYAIKPEFHAIVEAQAKFLSQNRDRKIRLEGNTDERGSKEYNMALGQRRADAVKSALKVMGVTVQNIDTTSWGESKPQATGHDETAWAKNRRVDIFPREEK